MSDKPLSEMTLAQLGSELLSLMYNVWDSQTDVARATALRAEFERRDAERARLVAKVEWLEANWAAHQMECHALQADDGRPPLVPPDAQHAADAGPGGAAHADTER